MPEAHGSRLPLRAEPKNGAPVRSTPEPALRNTVEWSDSLSGHIRELVHHRELLLMVTRREVKVRYSQTLLGALWALLQPLSLALALTLFFSAFAGVQTGDLPYPLFVYAGLLPWTFFATAISFATPSLIAHGHIITKIYFPREIVPLACVLAALVDFAVAAGGFIVMLAVYRVPPSWNLLYVLPLLAIQVVFAAGLCLLFSALNVVYRDIRFTVPLLLQLWMFVTPILYPATSVPVQLRGLYLALNPMAVIAEGYRRAVLPGEPPEPAYLASAALIALLLIWLAYGLFKRLEKIFADVV